MIDKTGRHYDRAKFKDPTAIKAISLASKNKYGNKKLVIDDHKFDSKREARRYQELKMMLRTGIITDLELQKPFILQETCKNGNGETIRRIKYVADFVYKQNGLTIVEDTKGYRNSVYLLKKKLFEHKYYPTTIREV